ncbi:MAG: HK97 family phage prohead protease [Selenomonadaceae bacterium]|nr:HK97 family phage prohead protease [Selenomonadaceae bacterium]MBP3722461.1 HK97 family phage prohead protease [Selenomonadaceae bacterium]MBR3723736.1 HK97 family phage prohead protease [Selenomonadaceae bacterium]
MEKNKDFKNAPKTVQRSYSGLEFRAEEENGEKIIEGHPAVYNRTTQIGDWFKEVILPGAFDKADLTDVALFVNHNIKSIPLARSRRNNGNSTMTLTVDDIGLHMRAVLDTENNEDAKMLYSAVSRGDMDGMSFAFRVQDEEWIDLDSDMPTRKIKSISKVFEVSVVTYPAYKDTDIHARAGDAPLESGEEALKNARQKASLEKEARQSVETENEIELYKMKNRNLGGI